MKLCYQVATPDVQRSPTVTAYQGELSQAFAFLSDLGYEGVELMVRDPFALRAAEIAQLAAECGLEITVLCTGEVYGQDKLALIDPDAEVRRRALQRTEAIIDLAAALNAQVNIGRLRGQYNPAVPREVSYGWALDAFKRLAAYAETRNVTIVLEPINILQSNFINTTREGLDLVRAIGSPRFRLMLDLFHMHIEDPDILAAITESAGLIGNVHLTDSNRRYPGHCKLDFPAILRRLRASGYQGPLAVEVLQLPDQETAARESIRYLRPILEQIKKESEG